MKIARLFLLSAFTLLLLAAAARADINYQFVTVGNPGNANDTTGYGGVSYTYDIGKYDVTLNQYTAFLNAVATTSDPYALYNSKLGTDLTIAGIARAVLSGSYSFSVIGDGQRPVTYVSWLDVARFCNWLHNGQPSGSQTEATTEAGAYTLSGTTSGGLTISRNANAKYWIPSENEWYKAAYYDPTLNEGMGGYWVYPTRSNSAPGNLIGGVPNQANYEDGVYSVTQRPGIEPGQNYLTNVGAFTNSVSAYGTYDQGGDVNQWNDSVIGSSRGYRGGSWIDQAPTYLRSYVLRSSSPTTEHSAIGFRIAGVSHDGDSDGIPDAYETGTGIYVSATNTGTSPTNPDTDGDGLTDGQEVNIYHTNPNVKDTDGDGFEDGFEVSSGFDPTSATSTPDALSSIRTAVEYRFSAANGISYRIESSADLVTWTMLETNIIGTGGVVTRFYSIEGQAKRFFRSRRN